MTKKRESIDLVGRLASRMSLSAQEPPSEVAPPSSLALRAGVGATAPLPPAPAEPRIVGREAPRVEPIFARGVDATPSAEPPPAPTRFPHPLPRAETHADTPPPAAMEAPHRAPALASEGDIVERARETPVTAPAIAATDAVDRPDPALDRKYVDLNLVRLHKDGFLTPQNQRSLIAEEYRIVKRPLLRAAFDHANDPGNLNHVVMITSARPGEGKTFTAINLAMSVATERDLFVLLVDCDIRRMGLSKKLGVADRKGLMDVLVDPGLTIADVLLRTNIPNLAIIPAGQPIEASTEVFASAKMTTLVDDIATRYPDRFIIFDAPPVLASSEPGVLAVHVGQTVMVVHANETSKRAIAQSIPLINGCPNVHFVLNRVTHAAGSDRFGYYGTY